MPADPEPISRQIDQEIAGVLARAAGQPTVSAGADAAGQRPSGDGSGAPAAIGGAIAGIRNPEAAQRVLDQIGRITAQMGDDAPAEGRLSAIRQQILEVWELPEPSAQKEGQHG